MITTKKASGEGKKEQNKEAESRKKNKWWYLSQQLEIKFITWKKIVNTSKWVSM